MKFIENIKEENEFPILFIGAGIPKRFLINFTDWTTLLNDFWSELRQPNFYGTFNSIRDDLKKCKPEYSEKALDYYANIKMGTKIEQEYNKAFNSEMISINNYSTKDAYYTKISPFKQAIAQKLKHYKIKDEMDTELFHLKKMMLKAQIILTTNYDTFIEDLYNKDNNKKIKRYIGQKGFFEKNYGIAELYKIHGCVSSPSDIIITEKDYHDFDRNCVLISARIISMLINSPIIFIGYSLTDNNIRKIIKDFTYSLSEKEIDNLEKRLVVVEWKRDEQNFIEEITNDKDLGCKVRVIRTDKFQKIFEIISNIQQGVAPYEIRKYYNIINRLIVDRGKKGALNSVLISPIELDALEKGLEDKNIVVAIGNEKHIFQIPDIVTYCIDYISDTDDINSDIRMRFITQQQGRFPVNKVLNENSINMSTLHPTEKEKLKQKIKKYSNFKEHYDKIVDKSVYIKNANSVNEIVNYGESKKYKIYETLSYNIKH